MRNSDGESHRCELVVHLERNARVHVFKSIILSLLTVIGCLLANYMHPADHTGDRAAIVLVAGLILTANIQADLKLGRINYLIWQDGLNLLLLLVTLVALVQTMVVHRYWHHGAQRGFAITIDRVSIVAITHPASCLHPVRHSSALQRTSHHIHAHPLTCAQVSTRALLYYFFPLLVGGYMFTAIDSLRGLGIFLLVLTPISTAGIIYGTIHWHERMRHTMEHRAVEALRASASNGDEQSREAALRGAFEIFDREENGGLNAQELRHLLKELYPKATQKQLNAAIKSVRSIHFDNDSKLTFDGFLSAQTEIEEFISPAEAGGFVLGVSTKAIAKSPLAA